MSPKKKNSTKTKSSPQRFIVEEPEAAYHIMPKNNLRVAHTGINKESTQENYIKRSLELMGMMAVKPFSEVENVSDFINCIREGVPKQALDNLINITGITINEISNIIRTSDRTLRRYTPKQKLNAEQSERVIELAKLYSRGEEVFGSLDAFKEWMDSTVMALGNKEPKEFLDTSLGIEMLMNELGRIEQGIFA
ncbi:MAG TPA: antitoxin Xre-like helix-turn-helix domain-containing protein [Chitinophagaceae bacterium]|nr:antitoxin Xre-like helix-turn-helix domain-containing protein [Chitinophagaceae bacterium]